MNEAHRYQEAINWSWAQHQAEIIRCELLDKGRGQVDGLVRLRHALHQTQGGVGTGEAGYLDDALSTGLKGFDDFVHRCYSRRPVVALCGMDEPDAAVAARELAGVSCRATFKGCMSLAREPALGASIALEGDARLLVLDHNLSIVERALLGAAAQALPCNSSTTQFRLHLWGDSVAEVTTPPYQLLLESTRDRLGSVEDELAQMTRRGVFDVVEAAIPTAAKRVRALAARLCGPTAAVAWTQVLERDTQQRLVRPEVPWMPTSSVVDGVADLMHGLFSAEAR